MVENRDFRKEVNSDPETETYELAGILYRKAVEKKLTLSTVESLTCGMIAASVGGVPGISAVYRGGFVTYCDEMKNTLVGVRAETLREHGAISAETAAEMCLGAAMKTGTDLAVSATGNAGPDAQEGKPVGLVFIGVACHGKAYVTEHRFAGSRNEIRAASVRAALGELIEVMNRIGEE